MLLTAVHCSEISYLMQFYAQGTCKCAVEKALVMRTCIATQILSRLCGRRAARPPDQTMVHASPLTSCRHRWSLVHSFSTVHPTQRRAQSYQTCRCTAGQERTEPDRRDTLLSLAAVTSTLSAAPAFADPAPVPGMYCSWLATRDHSEH